LLFLRWVFFPLWWHIVIYFAIQTLLALFNILRLLLHLRGVLALRKFTVSDLILVKYLIVFCVTCLSLSLSTIGTLRSTPLGREWRSLSTREEEAHVVKILRCEEKCLTPTPRWCISSTAHMHAGRMVGKTINYYLKTRKIVGAPFFSVGAPFCMCSTCYYYHLVPPCKGGSGVLLEYSRGCPEGKKGCPYYFPKTNKNRKCYTKITPPRPTYG
jgi:hypothetical protein